MYVPMCFNVNEVSANSNDNDIFYVASSCGTKIVKCGLYVYLEIIIGRIENL